MESDPIPHIDLAGSLLAASPLLRDPNFSESIVLLSAHSVANGAVGVIINRPTGDTLGNLRDDVEGPVLRNLPVYAGGPVCRDEILLAAWRWNHHEENLRIYFGMDPFQLEHLLRHDPSVEARAFLGYAGWGGGQLEHELSRDDWAIGPFLHRFGKTAPQNLWRQFLRQVRPVWGVLADSPDNPSVN